MRNNSIKSFAVGVITGSFLTTGIILLAAPAKADTTSTAFAANYGTAVCNTIAQHPTTDGLLGVMSAITDNGLTDRQAGEAVAMSVFEVCPEYTWLLKEFVSKYGKADIA